MILANITLEKPITKLPSNRNKLGLTTSKKNKNDIAKIEEMFSRLQTKTLKDEGSSIKVINKNKIETFDTESSASSDDNI